MLIKFVASLEVDEGQQNCNVGRPSLNASFLFL